MDVHDSKIQRVWRTREGPFGHLDVRLIGPNYSGGVSDGQRKSMISIPGIAGVQARTIRQFEYEAPPGSAVILHSDGVSSRWEAAALPALEARDPLLIAAVLLAEAGVHRDDAGVLVLKS